MSIKHPCQKHGLNSGGSAASDFEILENFELEAKKQLHHEINGTSSTPYFAHVPVRYPNHIITAKMPATTAETLSIVNRTVSVAPLVLLSAADHYGRSAKGTRRRVVGVLLGQNDGKSVRVSNSFAGAW